MKPLAITVSFLLLGFLACDLASDSTNEENGNRYRTVALNDTFRINLYETVRVDSTDLLLTFSDVTTDSRCPKGAVCIWPGEASPLFTIHPAELDSALVAFVLAGMVYDQQGIEQTTLGYRFTVELLDPYPVEIDTTSARSDYNVLMKVQVE